MTHKPNAIRGAHHTRHEEIDRFRRPNKIRDLRGPKRGAGDGDIHGLFRRIAIMLRPSKRDGSNWRSLATCLCGASRSSESQAQPREATLSQPRVTADQDGQLRMIRKFQGGKDRNRKLNQSPIGPKMIINTQ